MSKTIEQRLTDCSNTPSQLFVKIFDLIERPKSEFFNVNEGVRGIVSIVFLDLNHYFSILLRKMHSSVIWDRINLHGHEET